MKNITHLLRITSLLLVSAVAVIAGQSSGYDLPAAGGYDLVSYHQESGPVRGTGFHKAVHDGVDYLFANEANKVAFEANPEKYLPAYNGYCAYGVAIGQKFNSDPTVYELVDGRLYLNLDRDIQKTWAEDIDGNIVKADQNWTELNNSHQHAQR